jgi:hypothetical protein
LKINNNVHALAEPFRVYPKGRQIAWSACSSFVFILASNGEDIQIINQQGELIHSISASALNKQVANKNCIKINILIKTLLKNNQMNCTKKFSPNTN